MREIKFFLNVLLLIMFASFAYADGSNNTKSDRPIISISGGALKACIVTSADFSAMLDLEKNTSAIGLFVKDIKNYTVEVSQDENNYIVLYDVNDPPGEVIVGGGAEYKVDKRSFKIISKKYYK